MAVTLTDSNTLGTTLIMLKVELERQIRNGADDYTIRTLETAMAVMERTNDDLLAAFHSTSDWGYFHILFPGNKT